jgi:hypothetical protein
MKSYIKIYGPPTMKAIKELQKIAVGMPEVCIMDTVLAMEMPRFDTDEEIMIYFGGVSEITKERCNNIISKSGESLGEHDFYFEWFTDPKMDQLNDLIEKIDEAMTPLGAKYTITTK